MARESSPVGRLFYYLLLVSLCAFMLLPFAWALTTSLKPLDRAYEFPPTWRVEAPQWSNYPEAATRLPLPRFLANSAIISLAGALGAVLTSSMAGYALARLDFKGRRWCFALVLFSLLIPSQVLMAPRFALYHHLHWIGTYKPLIVPAWLGGGAFNVFLFRQYFRSLPRHWEDAARSDGASEWQIYRHVALPLARPAAITAGLLSFVYHWREFLDPLLYLSDFKTYPVSLGLRMYQSLSGVWINLLMAAGLIALAPLIVIFLMFERDLMKGLGVLGRSE